MEMLMDTMVHVKQTGPAKTQIITAPNPQAAAMREEIKQLKAVIAQMAEEAKPEQQPLTRASYFINPVQSEKQPDEEEEEDYGPIYKTI
jgi:hypothetical protein